MVQRPHFIDDAFARLFPSRRPIHSESGMVNAVLEKMEELRSLDPNLCLGVACSVALALFGERDYVVLAELQSRASEWITKLLDFPSGMRLGPRGIRQIFAWLNEGKAFPEVKKLVYAALDL